MPLRWESFWSYLDKPLTQSGFAMVLAIVGTIVPSKTAMVIAGLVFLFAAYREGWFSNQKWYVVLVRFAATSLVVALALGIVWWGAWRLRERPESQQVSPNTDKIPESPPTEKPTVKPIPPAKPQPRHPVVKSNPIPSPVQNAPGGINIGRDNTGTAVVNNFGPPPLKISEEQQAQITALLKANHITSGKVVIFVDGPTIETQAASNNLVKALKDVGVDAISTEGILLPPMGAPIYPGISFDITPETFNLANEIGRALMASHVVNSPVPANQTTGLDALHITVRKP